MFESTSYFKIERGSERGFGFVFTVVFLVISLLPLFDDGPIVYWAAAVALAFGLLTLFAPNLLRPLNFIWFKFGMLLGAIVAPLVMMVIFYIVMTPIGLTMRLAGKDPLRLKKNTGKDSYWIKREYDADHKPSMKDQF